MATFQLGRGLFYSRSEHWLTLNDQYGYRYLDIAQIIFLLKLFFNSCLLKINLENKGNNFVHFSYNNFPYLNTAP